MTSSPSKLNEHNHAEAPARQLLESLGWTYVPRESLAQDRGDEREVLLKGRLRRALLLLNEWMTGTQADRAIFELEHIDATGMARNQRVHQYLTFGLPLTVDGPRGRVARTVRFFDFDHPVGGLNEFVVTTHFRVRRGNLDNQRLVIPDMVLFINGIPLVVMEAKSPSLLYEWKSQAVRQLRHYPESGPAWGGSGTPELFHYNLMCVTHCGANAVFAATGAPENAYVEWKWLGAYSEDEVRQKFGVEPYGQAQLFVGMLSPATLLDILRDYVVYEPEQGRIIKKLPRYQQYRAVTTAMSRILSSRRPQDRGGVVWHTQGSGKSLTMRWLATKLRRHPRLSSATIVMVTDHTQLDDQIARTFQRCGFPAPERIERSRPEPKGRRARRPTRAPQQPEPLDLQTALIRGGSRTIMTTVQKFEELLTTPEGPLAVLNDSDQVIVMVDEVHRTQYGMLGAKLSQALPNAVLVGFTGTPIDQGFERSTMCYFGPLIDSYTIPESVADGATIPIWYEARLPDLAIQGPATLDKLFDAIFHDETEEDRARIRRRYANKETVAEAERRIQMIALDIAGHFKEKVKPNGFKAQVVAPSRAAALRYAEHLVAFGVRAYPIITTSANDGPEFQTARSLNQDQVTNAFVNPIGEPEVLVVVDMLLTGFDAPVEQVLYLDRSLREHGLLQAVAQVNRHFSHDHDGVLTEKTYGLVVDYHGVSENLHEALSTFEWPDVQDTMSPFEEDSASVIDAAAMQAESHFRGRDLGDVWACVALFTADAETEGNFKDDLFEQFNSDYRQFSRMMDRTWPNPQALPYVDRLARLTEIRAYSRALYLRENSNLDWTDIGAKVKKLMDERIDASVRKLMEPVSVLDEDFKEKIAGLPHDEARASVMEHAIRTYINTRLADNPVFFGNLSDQLERIIQDLRNHLIDATEAAQSEAEVKRQLLAGDGGAAEHGLSPGSFAIYELIRQLAGGPGHNRNRGNDGDTNLPTFEESATAVASAVEQIIDRHQGLVDWQANPEVQRLMRRDVKRVLRPSGRYSEAQLDELANRIAGLAKRRAER